MSNIDNIHPATYALLLISANGLYYEKLVYSSVNSETETAIILEISNLTLPVKTLWDVVVLGYGCKENPISTGLELSKIKLITVHCAELTPYPVDIGTHNVQQIAINSVPGGATISGNFVERSTATGILAIVYALTESGTLDYYLFIPRSFGQQKASAVFECIQRGAYNVSLFSVEENGLPFNRTATRIRTLFVDQLQTRDANCVGE